MSRFTFTNKKGLVVAYGYDRPLSGYFITIYDPNLQVDEGKSKEENEIAEHIDESGQGIIRSYASNRYLGDIVIDNQSLSIKLAKLGCENDDHILAVYNYEEF